MPRTLQADLRDIDGRSIQEADSHSTLGFKIGQTDRVSAQVRRRVGAMLKDMDTYRLGWQSSLTRSRTLTDITPVAVSVSPNTLGSAPANLASSRLCLP